MLRSILLTITAGLLLQTTSIAQTSVSIEGVKRVWHTISLSFAGPSACENTLPNPFLDYRFEMLMTHSGGDSLLVPGYFAADGDAAETSAICGDIWRVMFTPTRTGKWHWEARFHTGTDVSVNGTTGTPAWFDGDTGSIRIKVSDKTIPDFRGRGMLEYVNRRYLQFGGDKSFFIQAGPGSPENFLATDDFDGTWNDGGPDYIKSWTNHVSDWQPGDRDWQSGKGHGIIGAVNYLASKGMNSQYFLTYNEEGDGDDVWPWNGPENFLEFDVSKLDQWGIVFDHMDRKGILKHIVLQEQENDANLNSGNLGTERKLYYREMIARFSHHLGLVWNLGEENTNTDWQRKQHASYIRDLDPYNHLIQTHTYPFDKDAVYTPLLGYPDYDGASLQISSAGFVEDDTYKWITQSDSSGHPWVVVMSEIGPVGSGAKPDINDPHRDAIRGDFLWVHLLHGGAGVEWYFGYDYANNDLTCEDFTTRDNLWTQTRIALEFMHKIPFHKMRSANDLVSRYETYCLALEGRLYVVHLPNGDWTDLTLSDAGDYYMAWFDPRVGGSLILADTFTTTGPSTYHVDNTPDNKDWVAVVLKRGSSLKLESELDSLQAELPRQVLQANMYPNPSGGLVQLQIDVPGNAVVEKEARLHIYDLTGRMVYENGLQINGSSTLIQLDLKHLNQGSYLWQLRSSRTQLGHGVLMLH